MPRRSNPGSMARTRIAKGRRSYSSSSVDSYPRAFVNYALHVLLLIERARRARPISPRPLRTGPSRACSGHMRRRATSQGPERASGRAELIAVLEMRCFISAVGAVAIIRERVDDDGRAARAVPFVYDGILRRRVLGSALRDGPLDVSLGILTALARLMAARGRERTCFRRLSVDSMAISLPKRCEGTALGRIGRALLTLYLRPFAVSGHASTITKFPQLDFLSPSLRKSLSSPYRSCFNEAMEVTPEEQPSAVPAYSQWQSAANPDKGHTPRTSWAHRYRYHLTAYSRSLARSA